MPRIPGHFEWDDDDLTPGNKKEGGLSDNLYDSDGDLKGRARFVPGEEPDEADPEVIYVQSDPEVVYIERERSWEEEERERRAEEERRQQDLEDAIKFLVLVAIVAKPHVERLWKNRIRPALEERKARRAARKALKAAKKQPIVVEATVVDSSQELAVASEEYRTHMSSAEAQARYLAALAARAFSDEQMKLVANANIVDGEGLAELQRTLAELPPQQVKGIIEAVEADPSVLDGDVLAELGKILGAGHSEAVAIERPEEDPAG